MDWKDREKMHYLTDTLWQQHLLSESSKMWAERQEQTRQQKMEQELLEKQQKWNDQLEQFCDMIHDGTTNLVHLLSTLSAPCLRAFSPSDLLAMEELMPLFPIAEVLSLQGEIGPEQQCFLRDYLNIYQPRYNLGQFTKAAIEREGVYSEWYSLTGLSETYCGQIWHTLIELICRQRTPESMQTVVNLLGQILYPFWFLECLDMDAAELRYQRIIANLNIHAANDQTQPYLHTLMLLQLELSKAFGGEATDYIPCLARNPDYSIPGESILQYTVYRATPLDGIVFPRTYLARKIASPGPDKIWEVSPDHLEPTVFFSE